MTSYEMNRLAVINGLLEMKRPLKEIASQLATLEWDYEGDGVELTRQDLSTSLQRFLRGRLSTEDIEAWANLIESREDVSFEVENAAQIEAVLHELANPDLTRPLDQSRAIALLNLLAD